jgi:hypothetical protein
MSYTMYLECPTCQHGPDFDITYNYSPMLGAAFGPGGFDLICGIPSEAALVRLRAARQRLEDALAKFRALEPSNGWGTADQLKERLAEMIAATVAQPSSVWRRGP